MVTVNNYYNNIPVGRDLNNLPNTSSTGTTVGYQYDGLTEEDRFVQKVLQEHYDKVYKENLSHSDPMAYIESKYCDVTSPNFCSYMTEDQRSIAYRNEKRMLQTGGKYSAGFARYDYALRNYKDVYTGASRSTGYIRNTDKEKQYARSVVNQQISNLFSKNGISLSKQADLTFSIDPYTYQLTVSGNADRDTLSQIEKLLNEGDNAKNIWTHAWICMHDADNEIVNSQASMTKANQYSLWHEVYETTGYDARNATYKNGTFIAEDGTDLLALFKEKSKNGAGYELYSKRWLQYAKNGWKKENDLVLKIGFDSSGLYDIGQGNILRAHRLIGLFRIFFLHIFRFLHLRGLFCRLLMIHHGTCDSTDQTKDHTKSDNCQKNHQKGTAKHLFYGVYKGMQCIITP